MSKAIRPWTDQEKEFITNNIKLDPQTGILYWSKDQTNRKGNPKAGDPVNVYLMNPKPRRYYYFALYRPVTPHQVNLRVHHVVWFLTHGYQSMQLIDHINGDPLDNRPVNLRQATRNQNIRNQVKHCVTEGSPYKGIHRRTGATRFVSSISADNLTTRLGSFTDPIVAARTYDLASICLHGEYGRRNFPDSDYSPEQIATMRDYLQAKRQPATSGTIH